MHSKSYLSILHREHVRVIESQAFSIHPQIRTGVAGRQSGVDLSIRRPLINPILLQFNFKSTS
jgi:hypothetical protein